MTKYFFIALLISPILTCCSFGEFGIVSDGELVLSVDNNQVRGEVSASISALPNNSEWLVLGLSDDENLASTFSFALFANSDGQDFAEGSEYIVDENNGTVAAAYVSLLAEFVSQSGTLIITEIDRTNKRISLTIDMIFVNDDGAEINLTGKGVRIPYES